jgi:heme/copper-type cytochrome/quinol oxidase subunit 2
VTTVQIVVLVAVAWVIVAIAVGLVLGTVVRHRDREAHAEQDRAEFQTRHGGDWHDWHG